MVIDVRKLKYSGKDSMEFSFDYKFEEDLLLIPNADIDGCLKVSGTLELHGDDVYVDGTVNCKIVGECARCLKLAEYDFTADMSVTFVRANPDEDDYLYSSGVVDLRQAVKDVFLTNTPPVIYCSENCKGLCPICGCNLNEKGCDCKY